jgi:hypothetical protein
MDYHLPLFLLSLLGWLSFLSSLIFFHFKVNKLRGTTQIYSTLLAKTKELNKKLGNYNCKPCVVTHHKRPNPHRWSDPELEVIRTNLGGLAFTDAEWARARARFDAVEGELEGDKPNV